jgi:hypothetical protein
MLSSQVYGQSEILSSMHSGVEKLFICIFGLELIMRLIALSTMFFTDWFNYFDAMLFAFSVVLWSSEIVPIRVANILRLVRVVLRISRAATGLGLLKLLRDTIGSFVHSLPSLLNVGSVLILFFFVYAVLGQALFFNVRHGLYVTDHSNFEDLGTAMFTLLRVATLDNWQGVMEDCSVGLCKRNECIAGFDLDFCERSKWVSSGGCGDRVIR